MKAKGKLVMRSKARISKVTIIIMLIGYGREHYSKPGQMMIEAGGYIFLIFIIEKEVEEVSTVHVEFQNTHSVHHSLFRFFFGFDGKVANEVSPGRKLESC